MYLSKDYLAAMSLSSCYNTSNWRMYLFGGTPPTQLSDIAFDYEDEAVRTRECMAAVNVKLNRNANEKSARFDYSGEHKKGYTLVETLHSTPTLRPAYFVDNHGKDLSEAHTQYRTQYLEYGDVSGVGSWLELGYAKDVTLKGFYIAQYGSSNNSMTQVKVQVWDETGQQWVDHQTGITVSYDTKVTLDTPVLTKKWRLVSEADLSTTQPFRIYGLIGWVEATGWTEADVGIGSENPITWGIIAPVVPYTTSMGIGKLYPVFIDEAGGPNDGKPIALRATVLNFEDEAVPMFYKLAFKDLGAL